MTEIEGEINALREQLFPQMSDVVMVNANNKNKRTMPSDDEDDDGNNAAKSARSNSA